MPNPWLIIGAIVVAISVYFYGHNKGWNQRDAEMQAEIAKKNEESRAKEQELGQKLNEQSSKLLEANNGIAEKQTALDRAIRSGKLRLNSSSCVQTPTNPATPTGDRNQAPSQPDRPADPAADADRATLQAIAEIVAQGDRNTAQLNACIDSYESVRSLVNDQR
jgi:FtsZ-interacting cell division protein ZipA